MLEGEFESPARRRLMREQRVPRAVRAGLQLGPLERAPRARSAQPPHAGAGRRGRRGSCAAESRSRSACRSTPRTAIDNPEPADHHMTMLTDEDIGSGSVRFAKDYVGADYHNEGHSHIDAFSHVAYDGRFYDGSRSRSVTARGAESGSIDILRDGLVGRGVLLDVPRLRGVPWLEPGEHVSIEDLEAAEREQGVRVGPGDILLVRTGHARRRAELPPWDTRNAKAGLHPDHRVLPGGARRRRARVGRQQRHRPEHHRGRRLPDPRAGAQRDGGPPARLPAVRGPRPAVRGRAALGVPVRRGAAAASARDRLAAQPDRESSEAWRRDAPPQALRFFRRAGRGR